jgi:hypothetical protein
MTIIVLIDCPCGESIVKGVDSMTTVRRHVWRSFRLVSRGGAIRTPMGRLFALSDPVQFDQISAAGSADGLPGHKDDVVARVEAAGID